MIPIFERNEMTECPIKPRQPTSIGITFELVWIQDKTYFLSSHPKYGEACDWEKLIVLCINNIPNFWAENLENSAYYT